METCQTSYKVLFHIKGYIRLEVPLLMATDIEKYY
jgi:hypothetical protein